MAKFRSDEERFKLIREKLYTAVVCDILDSLGFRNQAMRETIRPVHPDHVVVGRARTFLWTEVFEPPADPYTKLIEAMDSLRPNDVVVQNTDYSGRIVAWGELMSTAAMARGCTGAVVDGLIRDVKMILKLGFPIFARGFRPLDSAGRGDIVAYDVPIRCGEVDVRPGEIVFGDYDGVVVIPREVEDEALAKALEKVQGENVTREELRQGRLLRQVYEKYGIL